MDWTMWLWIGGIVVAVVVVGAILWFTVGPGRSSSSEPTATLALDTPTAVSPVPTTPVVESRAGEVAMPTNPIERNGMYAGPPEMQIDPEKQYIATLETEKGDIVVELLADKVPNTVNNFVFLAREGYFDNTTFHRVLADFMAQGGDPTGTGAGGPGYRFADEFHPDLRHDRPGTLSMANSGANTNGSQYFITYVATPWLDAYDENGDLKDCQRPDVSCHAVFGRVSEGMNVLESLTLRDPTANPSFSGDLIRAIRITER
jgi:peptidylprolyl isomerase/peptidyl-prolyl cis-trans isomerase B (cyclophilin B)